MNVMFLNINNNPFFKIRSARVFFKGIPKLFQNGHFGEQFYMEVKWSPKGFQFPEGENPFQRSRDSQLRVFCLIKDWTNKLHLPNTICNQTDTRCQALNLYELGDPC